jgi:phosphocarrier protein HPr
VVSPSSEPAAGVDAVECVVMLPKDLHARPAGQVALAAARLPARVVLILGERQVDARSVLAVMGLGAVAGTEVRVVASGPGGAAAAAEIARLLTAPEPD